MEELEKAYFWAKRVFTASALLTVGVFGSGLGGVFLLPWFTALFCGGSCFAVGVASIALAAKIGDYKTWLAGLIDELLTKERTFSIYHDVEKIAVLFPFDRFVTLCEIDQKDAWTRTGSFCYYEHSKKSEIESPWDTVTKTETLRVYAWFSFFDYLKFRKFLKDLDAKDERDKQHKKQAHEVELYKDFIQALQEDVKAYAENGPFKKEENHD